MLQKKSCKPLPTTNPSNPIPLDNEHRAILSNPIRWLTDVVQGRGRCYREGFSVNIRLTQRKQEKIKTLTPFAQKQAVTAVVSWGEKTNSFVSERNYHYGNKEN